MALQLVVYLLINRQLSSADFGNYTLLFANACFLQLLFSLGFDIAFVHFFSSANFNQVFKKVFVQYLSFFLLLIMAAVAATRFLSMNISRFGLASDFLINSDILTTFYCSSFLISLIAQAFYIARGLYLINNLILIFTQFFMVGLLLKISSAEIIVSSYALLNLIPLLLIPFFLKKKIEQKKVPINPTIFWKYALTVACINIVQFLAYRADFWLVSQNLSKTDLALYANAMKFSQLFWLIPQTLALILFRELSVGNKLLQKSLLGLANATFILLFFASILYVFFGEPFVNFFLSNKYYGAAKLSFQLLPGTLVYIYCIIISPYFSAQKKLWANGSVSFFMAVFLIVADSIFIPKYGLQAAVEVNNICYILGGLILLAMYIIQEKISWKNAFDWKQDLKILKTLRIG